MKMAQNNGKSDSLPDSFGQPLSENGERLLDFLDQWGQPSVYGTPQVETLLELEKDQVAILDGIVLGHGPLLELGPGDLTGLELPELETQESQSSSISAEQNGSATGDNGAESISPCASISGTTATHDLHQGLMDIPSTSELVQANFQEKDKILSVTKPVTASTGEGDLV